MKRSKGFSHGDVSAIGDLREEMRTEISRLDNKIDTKNRWSA